MRAFLFFTNTFLLQIALLSGILSRMARNKKVSSYYALVVHVGSGSVESALVLFAQGVKPTIIEVETAEMPIERISDGVLYVNRMHQALGKTLVSLSKKTTCIPTKIYVSLSSPWCMGQIRTIHYANKKPFTFTGKMGNDLIEADVSHFVEQLRESFEGEALSIMDTTIIETKVNGYLVANPIGTKGREVEMLAYMSILPKSIESGLRQSIERHYRAPIGFFSSSLASYIATRNMSLTPSGSYMLLSIENELSELTVVENDILRGSSTFPFGKNFLLRTLMEELQQSPLETISLLTLCRDGKAHQKVASRIAHILESVEVEWKKALREALAVFETSYTLPDTLIISASSDVLSWFLKMAEKEEHSKAHVVSKKRQVVTLSHQQLKKMVHLDEENPSGVQITLSTIYISHIGV